MEKKISEAINIRINLGDFQHIDITKYAEKVISFDTKEEMVIKEDELTSELIDNLLRNIRTIPERLGKKTEAIAVVEEKISKRIPAWLEEAGEPNIANTSKKVHDKVVSEQKKDLDIQTKNIETKSKVEKETQIETKELLEMDAKSDNVLDDDDLFN